jgi:aryl-alcohol dehydrogenase-like predicted oxidoreductase
MHFADVPYRETWEAMEALHASGKARHIGVSNLNVQSLLDVLRCAARRDVAARACAAAAPATLAHALTRTRASRRARPIDSPLHARARSRTAATPR